MLDPADPAVRKKGTFLRKIFDRTKHLHVIENSYCYICQTEVSSRSKHCSSCNKCVADFDHHCKWLNNCVGGRNYKLFLGCCFSAILTALAMFIIDLYLVIVYYTGRNNVLYLSAMTTWELFVPVCKEAYIIFVIVNGLLLLISILLIGHLLLFHCYLICKQMTTYDYIIQNRNTVAVSKTSIPSDVESVGEPAPPPMRDLSSQSHVYQEVHEVKEKKSSYEMHHIMEDDATFVNVVQKKHEVSPEHQNVNVSETAVDEPVRAPSSNAGESNKKTKKKKSAKRRSSSKVDLIRDEEDGDQESLSSAHSHTSLPAEDEQRYLQMQNERVLQNFKTTSTPTPSHGRDSKSRPLPLLEESAYENIKEETIRIESAASRPRSPSPKQSQRISFVNQQNDYVMRVPQDKRVSNSSLSTIALQDHDESGKLILTTNPILPPHREETFESKRSSKNSTVTASSAKLLIEVSSKSSGIVADAEDGIIEEVDEAHVNRAESPALSLSGAHKAGSTRSHRPSEVSDISLSNNTRNIPKKSPRNSITSELTNITLSSEKLGTETRLTGPIQDEDEKRSEQKKSDLLMLEDASDTATLLFEEEFPVTDSSLNVDFIQRSIMASEERQRSSKSPPVNFAAIQGEEKKPLPSGVLSDADSQKLASYVEAFKRRRASDQYSYGSDSGVSEHGVPLATLNDQDSDSYELSDTLKRVKKLSDAFPMASLEQEKMKKRSIPQPKSKHESMSEISVIEYNRKKKLKKRPSSSSSINNVSTTNTAAPSKQLPPLKGRRPLAGVLEEMNPSDTDA